MVSKKKTNKKKTTKKKISKKKISKQKKNKLKKDHVVLVSIVVLLALVIVSLSFFYESDKMNNVECTSDSGCVKVQTTCCPCNMGGEEVCVPISEKSKYEVDKSECPEDLMCTALYNCNENPCKCNNGNCSFSN